MTPGISPGEEDAMSEKTIEITVSGQGDLTVSPGYAHVRVGEEITWHAKDASSLLITFKDGTAVQSRPARQGDEVPRPRSVELRCDPGDTSGGGAVVKATAQRPGMFGYQLALVVNGRVYADASCPEIIIE
jgi:plastocyanin